MSNFKFSVILPICNQNLNDWTYRLNNINKIINYLTNNNIDYVELIIVEQIIDKNYKSYLDNINFTYKNIISKKVYYDKIFNKSWLYNIGSRLANSKNLLFIESDVYFDKYYFDYLDKQLTNNNINWCIAWDKILYLNENSEIYKRRTPSVNSTEGGIVYIYKDFFDKIGRYNEYITKFGGVDNEIIRRCEYITNSYILLNYTIYHMYHPIIKKFENSYNYNLKILTKCCKNPLEIINELSSKIDIQNDEFPLSDDSNYYLNLDNISDIDYKSIQLPKYYIQNNDLILYKPKTVIDSF